VPGQRAAVLVTEHFGEWLLASSAEFPHHFSRTPFFCELAYKIGNESVPNLMTQSDHL